MPKSQRTAKYVTNSKVCPETFIKNKIGNALITKIEARSRNHSYRGRAINITYYERVYIAIRRQT